MSFRTTGRVSHLLAPAALSAWFLTLLCGCGGTGQSLVSTPAVLPATPPAAVKSGPQLGYVWSDSAHTLRPVLGIPGSTQLGQSVVAEGLYTAAVASNLSSLALLQESDGTLALMTLPGGQPTRLSALVASGASLRFAPSGLTAIAFLPGANKVTLITNLLGDPKVAGIPLPQPIADAAVSDTGSIAVAFSSAGTTVVRTVSPSGALNLAATVATLGGMVFAGTGDSVLVADATANTLTLVQASTSAPSATLLPSAGLLKSPVALGASGDGRWAILANSADRSVVRIDLTAQMAPQRFACDCQPALAAPLSGAGVFRITGDDEGPAWIFDAAPATPRVLFIPASPLAAATKAGSN